jgi:hypothetical protein
MSTSTNRLVKTLSEINPDELPSFSSIDENVTASAVDSVSSGSMMDYFSSITWQTWLIVILMLAFLGINVFSYLEVGTDTTAKFFDKFFAPILKVFGYETLETTKQTIDMSATGTKAGVDLVADTTTGAINTVEDTAKAKNGSTANGSTNKNTVTGQQASSSLSINNANTVRGQMKIEKQMNDLEDMQQQNLQKALDDASRPDTGPKPDDALSRIQSGGSGKAGWCFIGEDRGFRTCSEIGQNDKCMSGDIFPSHEICMNPNLRP